MINVRLKRVWRSLSGRERRLLLYLVVVLGFAAWKLTPRYWRPSHVVETEHYRIESTAERWQTEEIGRVVEILYSTYTNRLWALGTFRADHGKLKMRLYKDRAEFRGINPGIGWAEAFYREPYCQAYYPADEVNPYHWMVHEAVHQLNNEVMGLELKKWLSEGVAEYFSVSRIKDGKMELGTIDENAYPVWWMEEIAQEEELSKNVENGSVIALQSIITGRGGPRMKTHFNLYYLHWWTLTHFVFEAAQEKEAGVKLMKSGGGLKAVEEVLGPLATWEENWHAHVRKIRRAVEGRDLEFYRTGRVVGTVD